MTTPPGTSTGQQSTGAATVFTADSLNNFMVWTGLAPNTNWINFASAKSGSYVFPEGPYKSYSSNYGPSFVLLNDTQGYVIWTDMSTSEIMFAVASNSDGTWTLASTATTIAGSKAAAGPAASLGMQNGQPVINIVWQDSGKGSMVLSQVDIFGSQSSIPFVSLGESCIDAPELVTIGGTTYLAWFDSSNDFNLVIDPKGGVNFTFVPRFTSTTTVQSSYAPCLVPLAGTTMGYLFWTTSSGVQYAQIGLSATSGIKFNPTTGCSGTIEGSSPVAAPHAQLVSTVLDGVTTQQYLVAWPDANGASGKTVYTTYVTPNFTPIPVC